ncbi:BTB/POZ domain-containing protein 1 (Glucose signal-repressing protein), partial [Durusdinium trenchii]
VAEKLAFSFGQSGDFTVVALSESADDGSAKSRREFQVWSHILSSWSDVFEKMLSHNLKEKAEQEVVIQDFSPQGVEAFLRFLYSGTLEVPPGTLVEVMLIADKYQVPELSSHCQDVLADQLSAETAWSIFEAADCFQLEELREESLHAILKEPKVALAKRPSVSETLLNEVLSSDLLCASDGELFDLLVNWNEAVESRIKLLEKYLNLQKVSSDRLKLLKTLVDVQQFEDLTSGERQVHTRSQHALDVIECIKELFDHWEPKPADQAQAFLSNWVNVIHNRRVNMDCSLLSLAQQKAHENLFAGNWLEWRLPHFAVKLLTVRFPCDDVENDTHLTLFCGNDSTNLQQVFSSKEHGCISSGQVIRCRCNFLVQRFRVVVDQGVFNSINIQFEGFLQEKED